MFPEPKSSEDNLSNCLHLMFQALASFQPWPMTDLPWLDICIPRKLWNSPYWVLSLFLSCSLFRRRQRPLCKLPKGAHVFPHSCSHPTAQCQPTSRRQLSFSCHPLSHAPSRLFQVPDHHTHKCVLHRVLLHVPSGDTFSHWAATLLQGQSFLS